MRHLLAGLTGGASAALILLGAYHAGSYVPVSRLMQAGVLLNVPHGWCSGSWVSPTKIATARHCTIKGQPPEFLVTDYKGEEYKVTAISFPDSTYDFSVITVDHSFSGYVPPVSCDLPKRGDVLQNVGNPGVLRKIYATLVVSGFGSDVWESPGPHDSELDGVVVFEGMSIGGQSGSGIYDVEGRLVGTLTVGWESGTGGFVASHYVCQYLSHELAQVVASK